MPLWDMVVSIFWFMMIAIFSDIIRDHELSGWGKRGRSMNERALTEARRRQDAFGQYIVQTAGTTSTADELAELRDKGTISAEEFELAKATTLGREPAASAPTNGDRHAVPCTT
jgi:hypothetical protein